MHDGILSASASGPRLIPWDQVEQLRDVVRHRLVIRKAHAGFLRLPAIGLTKHQDIGRTLVVDLTKDGRWIDTFEQRVPLILECEPTEFGTFCTDHGIGIKFERIAGRTGAMSTLPKHWRVTLFRLGRIGEITIEYSGGIAVLDPTVDDVLASLISDASAADETFEDWCESYGYDTDSRKAEATYRDCAAARPQLLRLLGDDYAAFVEAARDH